MKITSVAKEIDYGDGFKEIETRYAIVDEVTGEILDDAQGYGYKTFEKARKALWYKFKGGRSKIAADKSESRKFFKNNPGLKERLTELLEINVKEIARGEVSDKDIMDWVKKEFGVDIPKKYLKYL